MPKISKLKQNMHVCNVRHKYWDQHVCVSNIEIIFSCITISSDRFTIDAKQFHQGSCSQGKYFCLVAFYLSNGSRAYQNVFIRSLFPPYLTKPYVFFLHKTTIWKYPSPSFPVLVQSLCFLGNMCKNAPHQDLQNGVEEQTILNDENCGQSVWEKRSCFTLLATSQSQKITGCPPLLSSLSPSTSYFLCHGIW